MKKTILLPIVVFLLCGCNNSAEELSAVDTIVAEEELALEENLNLEVKGDIIARHGKDIYTLFDGGYGKNVIFRYKYDSRYDFYDQISVFRADENVGEFYGKYDEITKTKCIDEGIFFVLYLNLCQEFRYQNELYFISFDNPNKPFKISIPEEQQLPEIEFFDDYLTYDESKVYYREALKSMRPINSTNNSNSSSGSSSNSRTTTFRTDQDVYSYLNGSSYKAVGSNLTIRFIDGCMYANGQPFSGAIQVVDFNQSMAQIRYYSPISSGAHYITVDTQSETFYDESGHTYRRN